VRCVTSDELVRLRGLAGHRGPRHGRVGSRLGGISSGQLRLGSPNRLGGGQSGEEQGDDGDERNLQARRRCPCQMPAFLGRGQGHPWDCSRTLKLWRPRGGRPGISVTFNIVWKFVRGDGNPSSERPTVLEVESARGMICPIRRHRAARRRFHGGAAGEAGLHGQRLIARKVKKRFDGLRASDIPIGI
jgi:hypothetical protein